VTRVFLDDDLEHRKPPSDDWIHVTTVAEAIELIEAGDVVALSLDHDLGEDEPTGYEVLKHLEYRLRADGVDLWPTDLLVIHSANAAGVGNMIRAVEANARLTRDWGEQRATWRAT
jgi:hypothetical protein